MALLFHCVGSARPNVVACAFASTGAMLPLTRQYSLNGAAAGTSEAVSTVAPDVGNPMSALAMRVPTKPLQAAAGVVDAAGAGSSLPPQAANMNAEAQMANRLEN